MASFARTCSPLKLMKLIVPSDIKKLNIFFLSILFSLCLKNVGFL